MHILCLQQGDWINSTEFPSNGRDWEARRYADFDLSPNPRARDTDYPINDDNSPMKSANFNGVGGGTILARRRDTQKVATDEAAIAAALEHPGTLPALAVTANAPCSVF